MKNRSLARKGRGSGVSGFVALFPLVSTELACSLPYLAPPRAREGGKSSWDVQPSNTEPFVMGLMRSQIPVLSSYGRRLVLPPHAIRQVVAAQAWHNTP